ncbi:hypothetical protein K435DRAFT_662606 [Dendrothele bispora CBS 962.96]|uniref:Fungal pheromone STE3G-protein-coupled receptor n=1 Tax=Dendrothele bispora (strain CBS 962.96) TaxID=1314807 RepID=A0A4S8M626_DENBC|nr:hypothetical protein K435DRAFT_662606 [Dendrothele bispora CBS 962.96]
MPFTQTQTSLPLSDSDLQVLRHWFFEMALSFLLLGVQVTLSIGVLCVFVTQGFPLSKSRLALFFVTIMMLFLSLSYLVMTIEFIIVQIPLNGYNPPDSREVIPLITGLEIGLNLMERLNYVIGDIVVVWRAWVLFPRRLLVKIALSICLLGSFVGTSLDFQLLVKRSMENLNDFGNKTEVLILVVPLIFTNLTATALIGFKAW